MKNLKICKTIKKSYLVSIAGLLLNGCMSNAANWKEEVLLHDGNRIIVDRHTKRGGRHEIGQRSAFTNQSLTFNIPGSGKTTWEDKFSEDLASANFLPMMLDISNSKAYLVVYPMGCLSYNKWARPNPPYIVFKYQSMRWQQIALEELPMELKVPNLIFSSPDESAKGINQPIVSSQQIQELYKVYKQPEFKNIGREKLKYPYPGCDEVVYYKGMWMGLGDSIGRRMMDKKHD